MCLPPLGYFRDSFPARAADAGKAPGTRVKKLLRQIQNKAPRTSFEMRGDIKLATSYFRMAFRHTIIGATAFHFRVRNGNGWGHCAMVTRLRRTASWRRACAECLGTLDFNFAWVRDCSLTTTHRDRKNNSNRASFGTRLVGQINCMIIDSLLRWSNARQTDD